MKRFLWIGSFLLIALVFVSSFTSAFYLPSVREISEGAINTYIDFFEPILQALFGGYDWTTELLFERLLIFVILISFVFLILGNVPIFQDSAKGFRWVISACIAFIGVRYLQYEWLQAIILQYGVLAIALTSILPFIIFFFFIHNISQHYPFLRKVGWLLYIGIYFGLWVSATEEFASIVYFWTMIAALAALLFDGVINRYYMYKKMNAPSPDRWQEIAKLRKDISDARSLVGSGHLPQKEANKIIKEKEKRIKWMLKSY